MSHSVARRCGSLFSATRRDVAFTHADNLNRKRNAADKREGQTREARHAGRNLHAPTGSGSASGLTQVGSYVSKYCEQRPGIYRLIGLDEANKPAVLNRLLGQDHTGTLYIGCEEKTSPFEAA